MLFTVLIALFTFYVAFAGLRRRRHSSLPLPPSPKGLPILGHLFAMPQASQWVTYTEMARKLKTDILYLNAAGSQIIVLSSVESVREILIRRSSLTSSRPRLPMLVELMGWSTVFSFLPYSDAWRNRRRVFWQEFNPQAANDNNHKAAQLKYSRRFLQSLLEDPARWSHHIRYAPACIIVEVAYGINVAPNDDPLLAQLDHTLHHMGLAGIYGTFLVDYLPLLKRVPKWFPGAQFQIQAEHSRNDIREMRDMPYKRTLDAISKGSHKESFVSRSLSYNDSNDATMVDTIKDASATAYVGGADTSPATLVSFFAAMVLFPHVQRKAQEELDALLGSRLPTFEDMSSCIYTQAIMWETFRWKPIVPLGVIHTLLSEDVYNGYRLPEGSNIFGNAWAIMRDESIFPDPDAFKPERFIKDGKIDPELTEITQIVFGFGRRHALHSIQQLTYSLSTISSRICPGRFMVMNTLWILMASTLSAFNISSARGEDGREILPKTDLLPGFLTHLPLFDCVILPRSEQARKLILDTDLEI
ncbi:hypothetical protein ONZ45_g10644 [Pleurotus djamor]|nr:hypothetical protein ONZ45_g10644 [Pleurotus djamor]